MRAHTPTSEAATARPVDLRRFPWIRRLAADYASDFARLREFYAGDPADPAAWAAVIAQRSQHPVSPTIASVLHEQQRRRKAPTPSREGARQLGEPGTVAIITGQQAGLFGGPLFTLLKAVTAIKLARKVADEHGVTVVPVFWVDAEDHDWLEVSGCTVLDDNFAPHAITLSDLPGAGLLPVGRLTLTDDILQALSALGDTLPATEFTTALLAGLREAYQPGVTMADAFACWLERLLGDHGLVVYDSSDPHAKPLASPVFVHELTHAGRTAQLASSAGRALSAAGYHAQVAAQDGAVSLFHLNGERENIRISDGVAAVGDRRAPLDTLIQEATDAPQRFSPNVLLRPIVQDTIFPTVCYVAGPNELAYLGQLRGVYAQFGVPMPLFYQRASATLSDAPTDRFLHKYSLAFETLQPQGEALLNQLLQDQLPPTVEQALTATGVAIEERMTQLTSAVPQIDPTLSGAVRSTLGRMQHDLHTLHNKVIQAAKRRDETLRRQFQRAQALTFPNGHPQEREIAFVWFCNRFGDALVDRLLDELPLEMGQHWVLTI